MIGILTRGLPLVVVWVKPELNVNNEQSGVGVEVAVKVLVGDFVGVGVFVWVGVKVGVNVFVDVGVDVGVKVKVGVGVSVGVGGIGVGRFN